MRHIPQVRPSLFKKFQAPILSVGLHSLVVLALITSFGTTPPNSSKGAQLIPITIVMADQLPAQHDLQTAQLSVDWQGREKALAANHTQHNTVQNGDGALLFNTVTATARAPIPSTTLDNPTAETTQKIASASVAQTHKQSNSRASSWVQNIAYNPDILNDLSAKTDENREDAPPSANHAPFEHPQYLRGFFISIIQNGLTTMFSIRPYYEAAFE